jgi:ABC-type phosphate transport system permease subunit
MKFHFSVEMGNYMASKFGTRWQKVRQHPFVTMGIIILLIALIVLIIAVVLSSGTGFNGYTIKSTTTETTLSPQNKVTTTVQSQSGKTLWDLLQLLAALAIPVVVGFGAAWFTAQQGKVREQDNKDN